METEFSHIPLAQLEQDWFESQLDIRMCQLSLARGITHIFDGTRSVQERLDSNKKIVAAIEQEMKDRGLEVNWHMPYTVT